MNMAEAQGEPLSPPHVNVDNSSVSGRSNKSFKHLVRVLGPALRAHLGVTRKAKVGESKNTRFVADS